jgi:hypothetical protein
MDPDAKSEPPSAAADDLEHAHDVFARALRFLAKSSEDPAAALASDDPAALVRDLRALSTAPAAPVSAPEGLAEPAEADERPEPKTLPLRRRRSA